MEQEVAKSDDNPPVEPRRKVARPRRPKPGNTPFQGKLESPDGRAAQKGEGRRQHPGMPDGHQLWQASLIVADQTERDHKTLARAVAEGRLEAVTD